MSNSCINNRTLWRFCIPHTKVHKRFVTSAVEQFPPIYHSLTVLSVLSVCCCPVQNDFTSSVVSSSLQASLIQKNWQGFDVGRLWMIPDHGYDIWHPSTSSLEMGSGALEQKKLSKCNLLPQNEISFSFFDSSSRCKLSFLSKFSLLSRRWLFLLLCFSSRCWASLKGYRNTSSDKFGARKQLLHYPFSASLHNQPGFLE